MTDTQGNQKHRTRWIVATYAILFTLAVPWYFPADQIQPVVAGIPLWAFVSLACSVAISILTAYLALTHWPESKQDHSDGL